MPAVWCTERNGIREFVMLPCAFLQVVQVPVEEIGDVETERLRVEALGDDLQCVQGGAWRNLGAKRGGARALGGLSIGDTWSGLEHWGHLEQRGARGHLSHLHMPSTPPTAPTTKGLTSRCFPLIQTINPP